MIKFHLDKLMFDNDKMKVPELVEKTGVNKNTLYAIYNNSTGRVGADVVDRICEELSCDITDLMEYIPDKEGAESVDKI